LLVGTACVAIYSGWVRAMRAATGEETSAGVDGIWALYNVGAGSAVGGLLLWAVRRSRGMRFPRHPGEYLLIVLGISAVLSLGMHVLITVANSPSFPGHVPIYPLWQLMQFPFYMISALVRLLAAKSVGAPRWRRFFLLGAGIQVLGLFLTCAGGFGLFAGDHALYVLIGAVLAVVVIRDHVQGLRYSWTHWLGVGLQVWFSLFCLAYFVLFTFYRDLILR